MRTSKILYCAECGCFITSVSIEARDRTYWRDRRCDDCGEALSKTMTIGSADLLWPGGRRAEQEEFE